MTKEFSKAILVVAILICVFATMIDIATGSEFGTTLSTMAYRNLKPM